MINSLLILIISILPISLGFSVLKMNGKNKISFSIFLYLLFETIWQIDVAILYLPMNIPEYLISIMFRILRIGSIMSVPTYLFITYSILQDQMNVSKNNFFIGVNKFINKKVVLFFYIWSLFVYFLNFTKFDIKYFTSYKNLYYFPVYGEFNFIFKFHILSLFVIILITFIVNTKLQNMYVKKFIKIFLISSLINYLLAIFNFVPQYGMVLGIFSVVVISMPIFFSFIKSINDMNNDYNDIYIKHKSSSYTENILSKLIHEINNPLSALLGYCEILPHVQNLNEKGKIIVDELFLASSHLKNITSDFVDFIKSGKVVSKQYDINRIVFESINLISNLAKSKNIDIVFNDIKDGKVLLDVDKIRQVIINILKNSIEAIDINSQNKNITINLSEDIQKENFIIIDIKDTGCGIPEEIMKKIFTPFTTTKETGSGIGMTLCQKIISSHNGKLKIVESTSKGTHISIKLPRMYS